MTSGALLASSGVALALADGMGPIGLWIVLAFYAAAALVVVVVVVMLIVGIWLLFRTGGDKER